MSNRIFSLLLALILVSIPGYVLGQLPQDDLPESLDHDQVPVGFDSIPQAPQENQTTESKVALGRKLFFDPILSSNGKVSCASCHRPDHGFASPDPLAVGIEGKTGTRNAPTILNVAYSKTFNWDGRANSLEEQVVGPLTNEVELGNASVEAVVNRLKSNREYVEQFNQVFGPKDGLNKANLLKAIASFERALINGGNGVDRFRRHEYTALSQEARSGMWIFESRGGCWKCHSGPNLSDDKFHNTGVSFGTEDRDIGRKNATGEDEHSFQFRTPSLRNIALTPPYMHDGSMKSLKEVVEFYNQGGAPKDPMLDKKLKPLGLTELEVEYLVEFLKALNGDSLTTKPK